MSGWVHGKAVVNGVVQYLSVSSLQTADPSSNSGCLRKWWYSYLAGIKEPPSDSMSEGIEGHERIETFLKTGGRAHLTSRDLAGISNVPEPGPGIEVEMSLVPLGPDGRESLSLAPLRVAGIPMVGKIDCRNSRDEVVELIDWKFIGKMSSGTVKTPIELPKSIQMAGYAQHEFLTHPLADRVRISHGYFPKRGTPEKRSIVVSREDIRDTWEHANRLAGSIADAAREKNPDVVDANTRACRAYGRDCPAMSVCRAGQHDSLSSIIGTTAAGALLGGFASLASAPPLAQLGVRSDMSTITERIAAARAGATPTTEPVSDSAKVAAEMARLAAQETRAKHPEVDQMCADIRSFGVGFPTLQGPAADIVARLEGRRVVERDADHFLDGEGALAQYILPDVALLPKVIEDLVRAVAAGEIPAPGSSTTPAAPALDDVPPSDPSLATSGPSEPAVGASDAIASLASDAPKAKRGRPKKDAAPASPPASPPTETSKPTVFTVESNSAVELRAPASAAIFLYVDCVIEGLEAKSLWPQIYAICAALASRAGLSDIRLGGPENALGYGRGKAALAAALRETALEPGNYSLEGSYGDLGSTVVETMREVCLRSGGALIRGVR